MKMFWRVIYPIIIYYMISIAAILAFGWAGALASTVAGALLAIPILGCFFIRDQRMRGENPLVGKLSMKQIGCIAVFGMGVCIAANNLIELSHLSQLFTGFAEVSAELYSPPLWMQIAGMGIIIPITEELIFRGLGYQRMRDSYHVKTAAVLSALLFACYHGNVVQGVYAFILGLCMCWVYERFSTILAPILFHQAANLVSVAVTYILGDSEAFGSGISLYIITLAAAAAALWSVRQIKRNSD